MRFIPRPYPGMRLITVERAERGNAPCVSLVIMVLRLAYSLMPRLFLTCGNKTMHATPCINHTRTKKKKKRKKKKKKKKKKKRLIV